MFNLLLTAAVSTFLAVGLVDVIKVFLPETTKAQVKAIVAILVELAISIFTGLIGGLTVVQLIFVVIATVAASQIFYNDIIKLFTSLISFIKSKISKK